MTKQEKDRIECAIRHIQTAVDVDQWAVEIAVEAMKTQLSAEGTTSDLISRQVAIGAISSMFAPTPTQKDMVEDCLEIIENLPAAQPEPQWIPVSERLPEKYGNYLISIQGEDEPDIGTINPNDKRGWSLCDANGFYWASDKELIVTAWMPLPEPYRVERRTDA